MSFFAASRADSSLACTETKPTPHSMSSPLIRQNTRSLISVPPPLDKRVILHSMKPVKAKKTIKCGHRTLREKCLYCHMSRIGQAKSERKTAAVQKNLEIARSARQL